MTPQRRAAGYSGTPLPRKLGIKEGHRVAYLRAPEGFDALMQPMPGGVEVLRRLAPRLDVIVLFTTSRSDLGERFPRAVRSLTRDGGLWVAYPKKAARTGSDLDFSAVQAAGLGAGLVDNKSCAIDEVWSGVRFVYRRADRPGPRS